jgi:glucose/arabinose dehydrogenase
MKRCCLFLAAFLSSNSSALAVPTVKDPSLTVTQLVAGLNAPTTMAFVGAGDILVLQKNNGQVRRVLKGALQAGPVLDLDVSNNSERGLLGIALHPNFSTNGFVYLYFTQSDSGVDGGSPTSNRVVRYTWDGNTGTLASPQSIIDLPATPGPNHDGGEIIFGPDGKLYIVIGDLNRNGQLQNNSNPGADPPDDTSVILRLNDDGSTPGDNPFSGSAGFEKYFAYGIRNSFGMAFDPVTGKLWITHNGPQSFDEIDLVDAGFNSGWNRVMGPAGSPSGLFVLPGSHYADPKFSWRDTVAPTGIVFLDSTVLGAQHENQAFVGDVNNGNLYRFPLNGARDGFVLTGGLADKVADNAGELNQVIFGTGFNGITDLKVGPDGFLYVVSIGAGAIYVIKPAGPTFGVSLLPNGEVNLSYDSGPLNIAGGLPPYVVTLISGALPAGLGIDVNNGISGTPAAAGRSLFTLQVKDADQAFSTRRFRIRVFRDLSIATSALRAGRVNRPYNALVRAVGGKKPFTWSDMGTLPAWLSLNPTTGRLTGTPPVAVPVNFTVVVTDALGATESKNLTLVVNN